MAPVILEMDVHCIGCAKKIRKSIKDMLGVERVWASPETGLVVVAGTADARALRRRIQHSIRKPVTIVSHGDRAGRVTYFTGMSTHLAPPPPPRRYAPPPPPHPYGAAAHHPPGWPYYAGNHWAAPHAPHHLPDDDDDEEVPNTRACCCIQ